jgi:glycosyltransferase 2 family protein
MNKNTDSKIEKQSVDELTSLDKKEEKPEKKKHPALKFLVYFAIIIIATGLALFFSLYQDFDGVIAALSKASIEYLLIIGGLVALSYCIDAFIIFVFSRLYTRNYKFHQGLATSMVGAFYSAVTPGSSGGQVMQIYTMKKQGVETSNAASIMIMSFIVYQIALIIIGLISLFFSAGELISTIGTFNIVWGNNTIHIPAIPLTIAGFLLNLFVIVGLFLMSYSHKFHNFIMHYGIDFLAKLHILKHPEETRESLRIQVENFKIELRRLLSNIPVLLLVFVCFSLILIIRFSIPFFAGLCLDGYGYRLNIDGTLMTSAILDNVGNVIGQAPIMSTGGANIESFWQSVFLGSYHQMATGLIPLPGAAGISEYFFNIMFQNYYVSQQVTSAAQIIWRFSTFHIVILISGIVSATYRSSPKNEIRHANRKTFVTMQLETYELRKASADTMFETASLSRQDVQMKLKSLGKKNTGRFSEDFAEEKKKDKKPKEVKPKKVVKKEKKKVNTEEERWDSIDTGGDD